MSCTIRTLQAADHADCVRVWRRCEGIGNVPDTDRFADFISRGPGLSQAWLVDDELVGVILASYDGMRGYLYRLAVDPDQRRQGIASRLVQTATAALRSAGAPHINLHLFATNHQAQAFWQTCDWQPFERLQTWTRVLPPASGGAS